MGSRCSLSNRQLFPTCKNLPVIVHSKDQRMLQLTNEQKEQQRNNMRVVLFMEKNISSVLSTGTKKVDLLRCMA